MALFDEETKNLTSVGMFKPIDLVFLALTILQFVSAGLFAAVPDQLNPFKVIICLVLGALFLLCWLVVLVLRTLNFVIRTQAKIEVITETAAIKAAQKLQQGAAAVKVAA